MGEVRLLTRVQRLRLHDRAGLLTAQHLGMHLLTADQQWATVYVGFTAQVIR